MNRRISALILAVFGCCGAAQQRVIITGTTLDCVANKTLRTAGVEIFIFPNSPQLSSLIGNVLKATDENVFERFGALVKYMKGTKALAHTRSDGNGSFKTEIPERDKVIVIGYMETEDNPLYWMHAELEIGHKPSVTVVLDYCKKQ